MKLIDMLQEQKEALDVAEGIMATAERANRGFNASEQETYNNSMNRFQELGKAVAAKKELSTIRLAFPNGMPGIGTPSGVFNAQVDSADFSPLRMATARNPEYAKALQMYLCTGGNREIFLHKSAL